MLPIRPTLPPAAVYVFYDEMRKISASKKKLSRRATYGFFQRSFRHRWSVLRYVSRLVAITSTPSDPTCRSTVWFETYFSVCVCVCVCVCEQTFRTEWVKRFIIHRDSRLSLQRGTLFSLTDIWGPNPNIRFGYKNTFFGFFLDFVTSSADRKGLSHM